MDPAATTAVQLATCTFERSNPTKRCLPLNLRTKRKWSIIWIVQRQPNTVSPSPSASVTFSCFENGCSIPHSTSVSSPDDVPHEPSQETCFLSNRCVQNSNSPPQFRLDETLFIQITASIAPLLRCPTATRGQKMNTTCGLWLGLTPGQCEFQSTARCLVEVMEHCHSSWQTDDVRATLCWIRESLEC